MVPMFCNNCYRQRDLNLVLQLTRCYHVVCDKCFVKPKSPSGGKICPVCKIRTNGIAINRDMPKNVANYFADPKEYLKMYRSISKFQCEQRALFYNNFYEQQKGLADKKHKLEGFVKVEAQLRQQIEDEKKRIVELRNYTNYYSRDESMQSESEMPGTSHKMQRPRTPALNSTASTSDNQAHLDQLREFKHLMLQKPTPKTSNIPRRRASSSTDRRPRNFDFD
ncbi:RING finger protein narya [Drosophila albomicans]|uniref:RING finger protein narya n=1 Tax=Drosophila albomicans TaxID=7291 RepID=A0A6P8XMG2_DROAB|nr:RING finger protein narya [Drosophila albomicans]